MLVLSRKIGQSIVLPELGVNVEVLSIHRNRVRIGVEAPATSPVHREEVWQRMRNAAPAAIHGQSACEFQCEGLTP